MTAESIGPTRRAAVLTVSDRSARGERADLGGPAVQAKLRAMGLDAVTVRVVADERAAISDAIRELAADHALVVTTGGTGLAPRDVTPEATLDVVERVAPGFGEEMRRRSAAGFPRAILSRAAAGTLGGALVLNLPGSPKGAVECLSFVEEPLLHALETLRGATLDCAKDRR